MTEKPHGRPPTRGFSALAPELLVTDLEESTAFWIDVLGFAKAYSRPEDNFVYLEHPDGAQVMLCGRASSWEAGEPEKALGCGVMLQIIVRDIDKITDNLVRVGWPILAGPETVWRRWGDREGGRREIRIRTADGHLLMFAQNIGERAVDSGRDG